jgi:biotin carboxylase
MANGLRILLSDGSGLTARQTATQLAAAGHTVEVLTPDRLALTRFTRHVAKLHPVPPYGPDPLAWLDAAVTVLARRRFDVLLPTQEQVAVLARQPGQVTALGVGLAVPPFEALAQVQDKISAVATLARLGLPQPESYVATTPAELARFARPPVFVKTPIGTATTGVRRVEGQDDLRRVAAALAAVGGFDLGGVVVQQPVEGPLVMIQAVYAHGRLLAAHTTLREREGANGGASGKRSVDLPAVRTHLAVLGEALGWHGALALDAILTRHGPCYIDVNPRLVEPGNAWRAGVDLVDALLKVSLSARGEAAPQPPGQAGVRTHQLLLAVLAAAAHGGRRAVLYEVRAAARHTGPYRGSREELTPTTGDWRAGAPVAVAAAATLIRPASWRWFAAGAVANYALTPKGWCAILAEGAPLPR